MKLKRKDFHDFLSGLNINPERIEELAIVNLDSLYGDISPDLWLVSMFHWGTQGRFSNRVLDTINKKWLDCIEKAIKENPDKKELKNLKLSTFLRENGMSYSEFRHCIRDTRIVEVNHPISWLKYMINYNIGRFDYDKINNLNSEWEKLVRSGEYYITVE